MESHLSTPLTGDSPRVPPQAGGASPLQTPLHAASTSAVSPSSAFTGLEVGAVKYVCVLFGSGDDWVWS